jgi:hypothetical protein
MTWDENDALGAMAGWKRCRCTIEGRPTRTTGCGHMVEPWRAGGLSDPYGDMHPTCLLITFYDSHSENIYVLKAIEEAANDL